jgi:hypothetical protein
MTIILISLPQFCFNWWLGREIGPVVSQLVVPLAIANFLRQITSPYTIAVLGLGRQSNIWISPAVEAVSAILFGITLGCIYGATGVAYGVVVAALLRLSVTAWYDLGVTQKLLPLSYKNLIFLHTTKID